MSSGSVEKSPTSTRLRQLADLPGPRAIPVFGNLLQIESTRLHLQFEQWCEEFGPLLKLQLGKRRVAIVGDHELIATAIVRNTRRVRVLLASAHPMKHVFIVAARSRPAELHPVPGPRNDISSARIPSRGRSDCAQLWTTTTANDTEPGPRC